MSYVVLARKWRPMAFDDLVGQEHVSRTLGNAIRAGRVAHAFLFTGVRGVGKTTSARILAKALNCIGPPEAPNDGPTVTPCLQCAACREITQGTDIDVREIDGASYNGVDEVRKLQDSLPYRPARDRYKIFIVDEVHMLSTSAWNAFLKTLEEPPPHVKFIFATTEVHKVPITILSRVQRFDFKLIPTTLIAKRLKHVLTTEGIQSDDGALSIIAREAAGSMRDAMSLLDQVIAWNDRELDEASVARVLGVASRKVLYDVANALVTGDAARCVQVVTELAHQGYDIGTVARDLLALLRDLVVAKVCKDPGDLLELADEEHGDIVAISGRTDTDDLVRLHQGFSAGYDDVVRSSNPRSGLEMLLVRLSRRPALIPIDDLVSRLSALEKRLTGGTRAPGGGGGGGPSRDDAPRRPSQEPSRAPLRTEPVRAEPPPSQRAEPPHHDRAPALRDVPARELPSRPSEREPRPPPSPKAPASLAESEPPPVREQSEPAERRSGREASRGGKAPVNEVNGTAPASSPVPASTDPKVIAWRAIVQTVRESEPKLASFLNHAKVIDFSREKIVLGLESGMVFDRGIRREDAIAAVKAAAAAHLQSEPSIVLETTALGDTKNTVAELDIQERLEKKQAALLRAKGHPRIADATQILGARLKEIRLPDD
jgi:DNA polymerase-3 subunit gamma/tau